jgi:hypothetical protein
MDDISGNVEREIASVCEYVGVLVVDVCGTEVTNDKVAEI